MSSKQEIKTLVVCIGTGGVFYHGLTMMSNFLARRESPAIVLIDGDVVEEKNRLRQWGFGIGEPKVSNAEKVLSCLTSGLPIVCLQSEIEKDQCLSSDVLQACGLFNEIDDCECNIERLFVIHAPDNHLCRVRVHNGCTELQKLVSKPVIEITGGNTLVNGYAFGCEHGENASIKGDYMLRHPDIVSTAEAELYRLENPLSCGSLASSAGGEQSVGSNSLTAYCVWSLAEKMVGGFVGESMWALDEEDRVNMWSKEVD